MNLRMKPLANRKISTTRHRAIVSQRQSLHNGIVINRLGESESQYSKTQFRIQRIEKLLSRLDGLDKPVYTRWIVHLFRKYFVLTRNKRVRKSYLTHYTQLQFQKVRLELLERTVEQYRELAMQEEFVISENEISRIRESIEESMKYATGW